MVAEPQFAVHPYNLFSDPRPVDWIGAIVGKHGKQVPPVRIRIESTSESLHGLPHSGERCFAESVTIQKRVGVERVCAVEKTLLIEPASGRPENAVLGPGSRFV